MVKRLSDPRGVLSPGLLQAPVLERMCSHFVLTLVLGHSRPIHNPRRDWSGVLGLAGRHLVWPRPVLQRLRSYLARRCEGNEHWSGHELLADTDFIQRHGLWRGPYEESSLFFYLDEYIKDAPKDLLQVLSTSADWLAHSLKKQATLVEQNIAALGGLLQLNPAERAVLLYGTLARYQRELRSLLVEFKVANAQEAFAMIARVAGVDEREVADALRTGSRLERIGMVENLISEHNITDLADVMKVSDQLPPVLMREYPAPTDLMAVFTRPASATALTPHDFGYVADDVQMIQRLLRGAVAQHMAGVNILLYGPPGTGKTELAKVCVQAAGLSLYEVEYADRDGNALTGRDRYRSLQISQVFLKGSPDVALLFDEVEDVFPPVPVDAMQWMTRLENGDASPSSSSGKAWVNQVLESNPVPVIWITNRIDHIDPAFRRRFQYHLELSSPPPGAREALIQRALTGVVVQPGFVARLAARRGLTPAQIRTAVRFAQLAAEPEAAADALEPLIERQLAHADRALGCGGGPGSGQRPKVTRYQLDLIQVDSRFPVPAIIEALRRRGHGTLCFHGPPGTGKTALAEEIARSLGRPLLLRQASDLVSKFVGETEQNMARMFEEAEQEQAVLLLDEADSFLRSRRMAERRYEVSEVNQMLQGMERFAGVFICTTNLFEDLDEAALRRFSFKLRFGPLQTAQREAMFISEALDGQAQALSAEHRQRLAALDQLTLGDFAAVCRQIDILGQPFDPDEFLAQLEGEHRVKPEVRQRRRVGFGAA